MRRAARPSWPRRSTAPSRPAGSPIPDKLKTRFAPRRGEMPSVEVARPPLVGYGALLNAGDAA